MSKNVLEAVERLTEELTPEEQARLVKDLSQRTRRQRWDRVFSAIDARVRRYGAPSEDDIVRLCRTVRRSRGASARRR